MEELVKVTDVNDHRQGTMFEGKEPDDKVSLPKSKKKEKALLDKELYEKCLSMDVLAVGDFMFKKGYTDDYRKMTYEEFEPFFYDIAIHGINNDIAVDEKRFVIYGWHRVIAAYILKLTAVPFRICPDLTEEDKHDMAYAENVLRRHMTKDEIDELVIKLRKEGKSLRRIGTELGISPATVLRKINSIVSNETLEMPSTITTETGKQYPSTIQQKKTSSISARSVSVANKIIEACNSDVIEKLPGKMIDIKQFHKIASAVENQKLREQNYTDVRNGSYELLLGDFREKAQEIEDESIDLIFTDPPYDKNSLHLWDDLGILAKRVLKPGGFLLAYSGQMYLPQIIQMLGTNLEYVWPLAVLHTGHTMIVHTVNIQQQWKPVLWYCKPPFNKNWAAFKDICSGGEEKQFHEWGQAVGEAQYYLKALCPKDAVVLDPMMGGATTVLAAKELGFKAIGIEADPVRYAVAQQRLSEIG